MLTTLLVYHVFVLFLLKVAGDMFGSAHAATWRHRIPPSHKLSTSPTRTGENTSNSFTPKNILRTATNGCHSIHPVQVIYLPVPFLSAHPIPCRFVRLHCATRQVSCLVLCHTRELAWQIAREYERFCKHLPEVKVAVLYGGLPVQKQREMLKNDTPHIVVGCPGRVMQLVREGDLKVDKLQYFVLDECDKMLDQKGERESMRRAGRAGWGSRTEVPGGIFSRYCFVLSFFKEKDGLAAGVLLTYLRSIGAQS